MSKRLLVLVLFLVASWLPIEASAQALVDPALMQRAQAEGTVRVIVELGNLGVVLEGFLPDGVAVSAQRQNIAATQAAVVQALRGLRHRVARRFQIVPLIAIEASPDALRMLEALRGIVVRVEEDTLNAPSLAQSGPLVGAPAAWSSGFDGTGTVIAVLDTGVDRNHPFLAGKVVAEACFSSTGVGFVTACPNGLDQQIGLGSAVPCSIAGDCSHGTHVAGIAAGNGAGAGRDFSGIARGANIMAVQVFSRFTTFANCGGPPPCARAFTADIIAALEHVYSLRAAHNIPAVNMSLGGGQFFAPCDADPTKPIIDNLRAVGIATIIASGNNGFTTSISAPACISTAISVGSTTKANAVSSFSNVASFLSLFAPGSSITSSVPGNGFAALSGTSMAAPHVAGAFAVLSQAVPEATVSEMLQALQSTGLPITDVTGITRPRIRIDAALGALASGPLPPNDYDGDGHSDITVFRPATGFWFIINSATGSVRSQQWGAPGDVPVSGDYDGDGKADIAVFRPATGVWFIINSATRSMRWQQWGAPGDVPVPGDYDGDGKADIAVFRPATGVWFIINSATGSMRSQQWGAPGDVPVSGDYDGDGKADIAVFRPATGVWFIINSATGAVRSQQWGGPGDVPVSGDYDGDGKADIAVFRPATGVWFIINSATGAVRSQQWGAPGDVPVSGDYDGDGKADIAVFRPATGVWFIINSATGAVRSQQWGAGGDLPTPGWF